MLANRLIRPAVACALLLLLQPWAAAGTGGYAALVKQVAPSVVTVLVAERGEGAAQRAVERATADTPDSDARAFVRRMLSGPGGGNSPRNSASWVSRWSTNSMTGSARNRSNTALSAASSESSTDAVHAAMVTPRWSSAGEYPRASLLKSGRYVGDFPCSARYVLFKL